MAKSFIKNISIRSYIIVLLVIILVMLLMGYFITNGIRSSYYKEMENQSNRLAKSYTQNLETAIEATDIINDLLEEKILAASQAISYLDDEINNTLLANVAEVMAVDEIYSYDAKGEVIYSSNGKYIGWKAYFGHPVYDFMHSPEKSRVEGIRQDTEARIYYKYGYFQLPDGRFFQIGVLAEKIYKFLGSFEMQHLLEVMKKSEDVYNAFFIDNNLKIVANCEHKNTGENLITDEVKTAVASDEEYTRFTEKDGVQLYQIMQPVSINGDKIGTMVLSYDIESTETKIRNISLIWIAALGFIYILLFATILASYRKNRRLAHFAYYDQLTELPNSRYLDGFIKDRINSGKKENSAVMMINCRNFKLMNLTYGYQYGDKLLKECAASLMPFCSEGCHLFHLGADRFILYVKNYNDKSELVVYSERIIEILSTLLSTKMMGVTIGIVEIGNVQDSAEVLLRNATIATEDVDHDKSSGYRFYNSEIEAEIRRAEDIKNILRQVIAETDNNRFCLEYQPVLDLKTNRIFGFEALSRLKTEELGYVTPLEFIPIAEKWQLIVPLGRKIMRMACMFLKTLEINGYDKVKVSVNISPIQLLRDDFVAEMTQIVEETKINPSNLGIEITEVTFSDNYEVLNEKLEKIKALGLMIAIDDFGTGYSSLARARELNVNCLKIDKYFIDKLRIIHREEAITGDIISMAHRLGHLVVAEGVEYEEQKEYLIQNDCDCMQGYLFSKPLPQQAAIEFLYEI